MAGPTIEGWTVLRKMRNAIGMYLFSGYKGMVIGILLGVCLTYFFQALNRPIYIRPIVWFWNGVDVGHPSSSDNKYQAEHSSQGNSGLPNFESSEVNGGLKLNLVDEKGLRKGTVTQPDQKRLLHLLALWKSSSLLATRDSHDPVLESSSAVPLAPHLERCKAHLDINKRLDDWDENGTLLHWTLWKWQPLGLRLGTVLNAFGEEDRACSGVASTAMPYPPWVEGADEDNLPMTRKAQQDIWQHQHPKNCYDPKLRFLLADWETDPGFGLGAQIASMAGMLAIALTEDRILVSNYFNRADHEECSGPDHSHWSCYFFRETSEQCRDRVGLLASQSSAWEQGLITSKSNYSSKQIWAGKIPRCWGKPWERMQPTTQIDGKLLAHHKAMDRRWWRAQAVRYLMRFRSEYMCSLLNFARHEAFGEKAAKMVLDSLPSNWPEATWEKNETDMDRFVWDMHKPWVPRPLVGIHARQGDKAREMEVVGFQVYMKLAQHLRYRFPHARHIWLSTEMQDVIEESKLYSKAWDIYFTNVTRQIGNLSMSAYEASLGRKLSTNYPLVNFLIAADADFFIGALGSTWCYLIDGMRTTSGRVMSGYLSVNKDRFW